MFELKMITSQERSSEVELRVGTGRFPEVKRSGGTCRFPYVTRKSAGAAKRVTPGRYV